MAGNKFLTCVLPSWRASKWFKALTKSWPSLHDWQTKSSSSTSCDV